MRDEHFIEDEEEQEDWESLSPEDCNSFFDRRAELIEEMNNDWDDSHIVLSDN